MKTVSDFEIIDAPTYIYIYIYIYIYNIYIYIYIYIYAKFIQYITGIFLKKTIIFPYFYPYRKNYFNHTKIFLLSVDPISYVCVCVCV